MQTTTFTTNLKRAGTGVALATILFLPAACSDEDGDGGVTDEEIQDLEDRGEDVGEELEEEVDAQDEGDNENG